MQMQVKFVWIEDGSAVELGATGTFESAQLYYAWKQPHQLIGFKPAPGRTRGGWLVFLVNPEKGKKPHGRVPKKAVERVA